GARIAPGGEHAALRFRISGPCHGARRRGGWIGSGLLDRSRVRGDRRERAEVSVLLTGVGRIDRVSGEQFGIARRRLCGRAVAFDQGGAQGRGRRLGRLLTPVRERLPAERAGAVLLVVAIAWVEAIEDGELAHFPLPDLGAPDAAAAHVAQRDPDRGLLAG